MPNKNAATLSRMSVSGALCTSVQIIDEKNKVVRCLVHDGLFVGKQILRQVHNIRSNLLQSVLEPAIVNQIREEAEELGDLVNGLRFILIAGGMFDKTTRSIVQFLASELTCYDNYHS